MAVSPAPKLDFDAALAYAERHKLHPLVAARGGKVGFECYGPMYAADTPHAIFSGTKSFWGIVAVAAQEDGLLKLDEQVAGTIHEWEENPRKELVTIRDLLNLTAGFGFGGLGKAVPVASVAIGKIPEAVLIKADHRLDPTGAVKVRPLVAHAQMPFYDPPGDGLDVENARISGKVFSHPGAGVILDRLLARGVHGPIVEGPFSARHTRGVSPPARLACDNCGI